MLVDNDAHFPDGQKSPLRIFGEVSNHGSDVTFRSYFTSSNSRYDAIYKIVDQNIHILADIHTSIPGGEGTFSRFSKDAPIHNNRVAFGGYGESGQQGVYIDKEGVLELVADTRTPNPAKTGKLLHFNSPSIYHENVAFITGHRDSSSGKDYRQSMVFSHVDGVLNVVADLRTPVPEFAEGKFLSFRSQSIYEKDVAFVGEVAGGYKGLYVEVGGVLTKILYKDGLIDGKTAQNIFMSTKALAKDSVVFTVRFTDGTRGVYRADWKIEKESNIIGEVGSLITSQQDADTWHKVILSHRFEDPVVIMGPLTYNGLHPSHIRIRNVRGRSFEYKIEEWDYLNGGHRTEEEVSYLVMESGVHKLDNGAIIESGKHTLNDQFKTIGFNHEFSKRPVVLSCIQSHKDPSAAIVHIDAAFKNRYKARIREEESSRNQSGDTPHEQEIVGYMAIEEGRGKIGDQLYEAGLTSQEVTHHWYALPFTRSFTDIPHFFAQKNTEIGADTADLRQRDLSEDGVEVFIEEERSFDDEIAHNQAEKVGFFAMGTSGLIRQKKASQVIGESGCIDVTQPHKDVWHDVKFLHTYDDPVVVMGPSTEHGLDPVHPRIRRIHSKGFEVKLEEWSYDSGRHIQETLNFLVMESGQHYLSDGTLIEAENTTLNSHGVRIEFDIGFDSDPVILANVASYQEIDPVIIRIKDVDKIGFYAQLFEEEAGGGTGLGVTHANELMSFIAIEQGSGSSDGITYEVGLTPQEVTEEWTPITFDQGFSATPVWLARANTARGLDPASVRYQNLTAHGVELHMDEETSLDEEVVHVPEAVGYVALEPKGVIKVGCCPDDSLNEDLSLYYNFDQNEGGQVSDQSGNDNHGVVQGPSWTSEGVIGGAYEFGTGSINLGDLSIVEGKTALSWGAWVYPLGGNLGGVMGKTRSSNESFYLLVNLTGHSNDGSWSYVVPESRSQERFTHHPMIERATWQHLMGTYDGVHTRLYYNGKLVVTSPAFDFEPTRNNDVDATIGDVANGRGWFFNGKIDEVRIYERVLTEAEIQQLYQLGLHK